MTALTSSLKLILAPSDIRTRSVVRLGADATAFRRGARRLFRRDLNSSSVAFSVSQISMLQLVVRFEKLVADLLNRPLRVDLLGLDFLDDAIDEKLVLKDQQVRVDQKRRLGTAAFLQLLLHASELALRLLDRLLEAI